MSAAKGRKLVQVLAALAVLAAVALPAGASIPQPGVQLPEPNSAALLAAARDASSPAIKAARDRGSELFSAPLGDRFRLDLHAAVDAPAQARFHLLTPRKNRIRGVDVPEPVLIGVELPPSRTAFRLYGELPYGIASGGLYITTDPLGYIDGPNLYQYGLNNPVSFSDPMGLACTTQHGGTNPLCNPMDEMEFSSETTWWQYTWAVGAETGGNALTEGLFLNVFADAPHVVLDSEASTGEKMLAGGKATGAAVLNLGGAGVPVKAGLGRLAATRPVQWAAQRLSGSRVGQRVAGVLMEDVGVLWRRAFGQADEALDAVRIVPEGIGSGLANQTRAQLPKSKASQEKLIVEHQQKLAGYRADPFAHDNLGTLARAPEHLRPKIIEGRIKVLEDQIRKQQGELDKILSLLDE